MTMRVFRKMVLAAAAALVLAATPAWAVDLTINSVGVDWLNPVGGVAIVDPEIDGNFTSIRWGLPSLVSPTAGKSGLGFAPEVPQTIPVPSDPFVIGTLRHFNFTIQEGGAVERVDLRLQ